MMKIEIDTAFITMQRPRYRFRPKLASGTTNTPTPPKRTFMDGPFLAKSDREENLPEGMDRETFSTSSSSTNESPSSSSAHPTTSQVTLYKGNAARANRRAEVALGSDADEDDDTDMTLGLHSMTMATSGSDMEINL
jgi:hypothetical protein